MARVTTPTVSPAPALKIYSVLLAAGWSVAMAGEPLPVPLPIDAEASSSGMAPSSKSKLRSGFDNDGSFAGPASTTAQLEEDDLNKEPAFRMPFVDDALEPWFGWKRRLNEEHGFQFGVAYTSTLQLADSAPSGAEDSAGVGILRLSGKWTPFHRRSENAGSLVFSFDQRHRFTDIAPADLGFEAGYLGIPATLFSGIHGAIGDLNWQQRFNDGRTGLIVGRYDPNDFFDVLGYANPWTSFTNLSVLFNASIALPDWQTGIGIGHWFTDQWYASASVSDANGTATDVQLFEDFGELYKTAEIGWSPSREERYTKNIHITGWHVDARDSAGTEESEGIAIGANWTWDDKFMLFTKLGWSDGNAPLYNESATVGMIYKFSKRSDLMGLGVNWGSPADDTLNEQWSTELFYRLQLSENIAITPSLQLIVDPALRPDKEELWIGGVRMRFTF